MDIHQQCIYCLKMYSYIGAYITHCDCNQQEMIVYISTKELPDDGSAMKHHSILLEYIYAQHCVPFHYPCDDDFSNTKANCNNVCVNPEQLQFGPVFMVLHLGKHQSQHAY